MIFLLDVSLHRNSARMTIGLLFASLIEALILWLLGLVPWPTLGRVPLLPNFFHIRIKEATALIGTFSAADLFFPKLPSICALTQSCLLALQAVPSTSLLIDGKHLEDDPETWEASELNFKRHRTGSEYFCVIFHFFLFNKYAKCIFPLCRSGLASVH